MADTKISDLTALAETPADTDLVPIVDISDTTMASSGTTKKMQYQYLTPTATTTSSGKIEIATSSEINTGTDNTRAVTPDGIAGSNYGIDYVEVPLFAPATDSTTGDGKAFVHIPPALNGKNLVYVHGFNSTAGAGTGKTKVQIHNVTDTQDMLSTILSIDVGEKGSDTAETASVINTTYDDVSTNDLLRIDVDNISSTAGKGTTVTMGFKLP